MNIFGGMKNKIRPKIDRWEETDDTNIIDRMGVKILVKFKKKKRHGFN
jgi:hypothetical protein